LLRFLIEFALGQEIKKSNYELFEIVLSQNDNEFPYPPSELYTPENALKTIELATKIITIVDDTYFSN